MSEEPVQQPPAPRRYLWPWILAAALLVGITIAIFSLRKEVERIKLQRSLQLPNAGN